MQPLGPDDPRALGRFRLTGHLGSGGMGRVYLGVDGAGARVAVKVVRAELAADPAFRERFRREVAMAATVPPWFTAPVVDAAPDADPPWLATAFVEGPSLHQAAPLGERGTYELALRVADGLAAVHGAGMVHRDLKPSNILLAPDGPRVIDFGIARAADAVALTRTGRVLGTPEFMSPEQASGSRDIGPASDMFAFGSVVAFAAAGRSPFAADHPAGAFYQVVYAEPDLRPLTGLLHDVVARCLAKDPAARPSAAQVADVLRGVSRPTAPPPTAVARRPRRWGPVAAVAAVGSAAAVAVALWLGAGGPDGAPSAAGPSTTAPLSSTAPASTAPTTLPSTAPVTTDPPPPTLVRDADLSAGTYSFASPSGNIMCLGDATGYVRCDIAEDEWVLPPPPADCDLDWGSGVELGPAGPGALVCAGDTVLGVGYPVLAYGEAVRFGPTVCASRETGVRCDNASTAHGFALARARYELF